MRDPAWRSPHPILVADEPDASDERGVLMPSWIGGAESAREEELVGPVTPVLAAHEEPVRELVFRGQRDLVQHLIGPTEQPLVVQPLESNTDSDRGGQLVARINRSPL